MWLTSYYWKKKFKYIYYKNRAFFLKIHRSSTTNCQCLAPTVSLAFILALKTNTEVWKVCASPGAARVVVEVRPADKMLVCVSLFWGKSQSCKQFREDEDDAEGSRGGTFKREVVADGRRTGWSALLMVSSHRLSACCRTKCFKQLKLKESDAYQTK